ncbi:MAG TPA: hypothetical protein VFJ74_04530 [Gemmatimonadaceae bacterium]|nr:hypothetical protein [Gemmatimonadaceae bacterium]
MPIHHTHWYTQLPIATLIGPVAGATIGYFVSKRRDRLERDTRQRTVAGALAAEVARIRTALGADARDHRAPDPIFYGLTFEPPRVHPWLERVIIDAADISSGVVSDFMALERELGHFATLLSQWREASAAAATSSSATPTRVAAIASGGGGPTPWPTAPAPEQRGARDRARTLYEECVATQRMAVKVLDRLEATLTPVLDSPAARRQAAAAAHGASSAASAPASGPGARWRRVKTRLRRAGVTVLADFGLGDGWPEESAPPSHEE